MALNFPSCSIFSTRCIHTDGESSRLRCERSPLFSRWETDSGLADVEVAYDPLDLLPEDPFGMGLGDLFGWTLLYSSETQFCHDGWMEGRDGWVIESSTEFSVHEAQSGNLESGSDAGQSSNCNHSEAFSSRDVGMPHDGLFFCLAYMDVQSLLSMGGVCRSLRLAVQGDNLLWRCMHINSPLSEKITDDILLRLTLQAREYLQCLSMTSCSKITDDGLKRVLDNCPRLKKLSVPGCVRLSLDGIINNLKAFQSRGMPGIEHLKLGGFFIISPQQYGELKMLLGVDQRQQGQTRNPRFYHIHRLSPACYDDCILDIEMCPVCHRYKLVYDCPSESCQEKGPNHCRACDVCIGRCVQCGKCVKDCTYVETFFLEYLCSDCWKPPPVHRDTHEVKWPLVLHDTDEAK
ncbi:hypothetical protein C4D60_Mb03t02380 [Musa balbisiana]|uniref:F-box domain-containing protein n=1 Tax=Musa balbisiana TaxID=52838 RepID=A0A4S8J733_MUSBA|nr:hypothetical protein C4D60_Mb03t02380 [Musa balbisiana]